MARYFIFYAHDRSVTGALTRKCLRRLNCSSTTSPILRDLQALLSTSENIKPLLMVREKRILLEHGKRYGEYADEPESV